MHQPEPPTRVSIEALITKLDTYYIAAVRAYLLTRYGLTFGEGHTFAVLRGGEFGSQAYSLCKLAIHYTHGAVVQNRWATRSDIQGARTALPWRATYTSPASGYSDHIFTLHPLAAIIYAKLGIE